MSPLEKLHRNWESFFLKNAAHERRQAKTKPGLQQYHLGVAAGLAKAADFMREAAELELRAEQEQRRG